MGKPHFEVYERFRKKYFELCAAIGKEQYLVPYLMSSHPGSTMKDAVYLARCLKRDHYSPEQVQDFYPTPGTASTVMYYTGINPLTGKKVYRTTDYHEKQQQRALLQFNRPQNHDKVREALRACGREDLIGHGPECLVPPERPSGSYRKPAEGGYHPTEGGRAPKKGERNARDGRVASKTTASRGGKSGGRGDFRAAPAKQGAPARGRSGKPVGTAPRGKQQTKRGKGR
jgi:hypothetical protein